ncbi:hypothetical protein BH10PSE16_BH10PSE16_28600 [soil metagenome]
MKTATRKLTAALTCFALLMGQMPLANARLGSPRPAPAGARPAPSGAQYQSPGRLGSGQSVGMQRPQVMQATRTPAPAAPVRPIAPVQQAAPAPVAPVAPAPGTPGWVKPALAGAAVGALAGYAMSNHGAGNGAVNSNGNGNDGNAGFNSNAAGSALAPASGSSGMGGLTGLLLVLLLAGAAFFIWRKYRSGTLVRSTQGGYGGQGFGNAPAFPPAPSLIDSANGSINLPAPAGLAPLEAFRSLQDFNSTGNKEALRRVTTPAMFAELEGSMGSAPLRILVLNASVQDVTEEPHQTVASVRYTGEVTEGVNPPEPIDEVWHFVLPRSSPAVWQLAGIEQV